MKIRLGRPFYIHFSSIGSIDVTHLYGVTPLGKDVLATSLKSDMMAKGLVASGLH